MSKAERIRDACTNLSDYVADKYIGDTKLLLLVLKVICAVNGKTLTKEQIKEFTDAQQPV